MKRYDESYFERFYLDPQTRLFTPAERRRRLAVIVASAERWLGRPVRSVVDVGCGIGLWGRELARLRPQASYLGLDPSPALRPLRRGRFELRRGAFAALTELPAARRFDVALVVDVLHYLPLAQIDEALATVARRTNALLALDLMTRQDPVEGDLDGLVLRPREFWMRKFEEHGLVPIGQHLCLVRKLEERTAALDRALPPRPRP